LQQSECTLPDQIVAVLADHKQPPSLIPLVGDASTRRYFRALYANGQTAMFMVYPEPKSNDESSFLDVHRFLQGLGLPVPRVLAVYPHAGVVILEDLGDELLESVLHHGDGAVQRRLYQEAVEVLIRMRAATHGIQSGCVAFSLAFDEEKLLQEMEFFVTHFVHGLCRALPSSAALGTLRSFFTRMCETLAREPRVFAHRDYHSRNLILHRGRLVMIDFQDARMGPAQYDLASLLRDSYVTLPPDLVDELLSRYFQEAERDSHVSEEYFRSIFDLMSLQRNIKALGTFGYQVSVRGSSRYLSSIPRTGKYIAENIARYTDFKEFRAIVEDLVAAPAQSTSL
jgi:N-acetylmuramate 1-kinase